MRAPILLLVVCEAVARGQLGPVLHPHALDDSVFKSCSDVLARALDLSRRIQETAYVMELFPRTQGQVGPPFPSEATAPFAAKWLASYDPKDHPNALFYFAADSYTLRCRDNAGNYVDLSGPSGSAGPLQTRLGSGTAEIWHFYFTPINNAHVFVVTNIALEAIDGEALMAQVTKLLEARHISLYVRNDPWFLGAAPDALPYLFTDSFKTISEAEYRMSRTLDCDTSYGCKLSEAGR
jgi:hypothetical protein